LSPREAFVDHLTLRVRDLETSRRFYAADNMEAVFHDRQEAQ
jgi:catechol 2,3-dioxygenase-like lactoylglutathione lyase family enzyme